MSAGYGKLFVSMYDGTLYGRWQALVTFQQFIILCSPDGIVDMTPHAIAARTSIPLDIIAQGIGELEKPDPYSRSPDDEGRRIELLDQHRPWGWRIVNHAKYKAMLSREQKQQADRNRVAAKRARNAKNSDIRDLFAENDQKSHGVANLGQMSRDVADVAHSYSSPTPSASTDSDSEAEAGAKRKRSAACRLPEGFSLTTERVSYAAKLGLEPGSVLEAFRDYWLAANGPTAIKRDWDATWRTWCRREAERGTGSKISSRRPKTVAELEQEEAERNAQH